MTHARACKQSCSRRVREGRDDRERMTDSFSGGWVVVEREERPDTFSSATSLYDGGRKKSSCSLSCSPVLSMDSPDALIIVICLYASCLDCDFRSVDVDLSTILRPEMCFSGARRNALNYQPCRVTMLTHGFWSFPAVKPGD